jgi:ComF family protein
VPVPLHHRKERERGFNQTRLIATAFAKAAGGTTVVSALQRVVDTATQTRLDREARRANLKNAFAMAPGRALTPGARIVLVDDIFTTGATLNACASVLRKAGFDNLDVATLAHG